MFSIFESTPTYQGKMFLWHFILTHYQLFASVFLETLRNLEWNYFENNWKKNNDFSTILGETTVFFEIIQVLTLIFN